VGARGAGGAGPPPPIEIVGGAGRVEADLRQIDLQRFQLTGGSERIQLELGEPRGEVAVGIVGGARTIRIERPRGTPARLRVSGGSGRVEFDGQAVAQKGGETTFESGGWTGRGDHFTIEVVGGSKSIEVVAR
jgi:hypothetical protein